MSRMNVETGEIKQMTERQVSRIPTQQRKNWIPLSVDQYTHMKGKTRAERRLFYNQHKNEFKAGGIEWENFNRDTK